MSHPKVCPCPNCLGSGSSAGWVFLAGAVASVAYVAWQLARFSAWAGRAPFLVVGGTVAAVVVTGLVLMIRGSVRSGWSVAPVVSQPVPEPGPTTEIATEPVPSRPRLVAKDGRRVA